MGLSRANYCCCLVFHNFPKNKNKKSISFFFLQYCIKGFPFNSTIHLYGTRQISVDQKLVLKSKKKRKLFHQYYPDSTTSISLFQYLKNAKEEEEENSSFQNGRLFGSLTHQPKAKLKKNEFRKYQNNK
jgi:hypothetical protein